MDDTRDSSLMDRHPWLETRTFFRRTRLLLLTLLGLMFLQHASASSRSSSRHRHSTHPRGKRRKRRRPKESTDPHDLSSSSPSFLPAAFSDEEDILSALAMMELEGDEEDEEEKHLPGSHVQRKKQQRPATIVRPSVEQKEKKQKVIAMPPRYERNEGQALDADTAATKVKTDSESTPMPVKEIPTSPIAASPIVQPSLTLTKIETIQQTPPRQYLSQTPLERPWYTAAPSQPLTSPPPVQQQQQQQQTVTPTPPQVTSPERRSMMTGGVTTPQSAYSPNGFARTSRQDANLSTTRWVRKFLASRPKDTLLPVPRDYLSDGFNLVQLAPIVERIGRMENGYVPSSSVQNESYPLFKAALRLILQQDGEPTSTTPTVQRAAEVLYSLVHARYAISPRGLDTVRRVLHRSDGNVDPVFGRCPRIRCRGMPLLPCGDSDNYDPRNSVTTRAKRYCPCCGEKLYVWDAKADESAWGPSFCHLFIMLYGNIVFPDLQKTVNSRNGTMSEPSIFGFRLHPASQLRYVPR